MTVVQALARLDRRWLFLVLGLVVVATQLVALGAPQMKVAPETQSLHAAIDSLSEGEPILISFDFDPASAPELVPPARSLLRHALSKKLRVINMCLWAPGQALAYSIIQAETQQHYGSDEEAQRHYGEDYVYLGWQPGLQVVIVGMGENLLRTYATDSRRKPTKDMPIFKGIGRLSDLRLVISISAGSPGVNEWLTYGQGRYHFPLGAATTSVAMPSMLPFVRSGQLSGLVGGMRGAAEYEQLTHVPGSATRAMNGLSAAHLLVIGFVIVGNVAYFLTQAKRPAVRSRS